MTDTSYYFFDNVEPNKLIDAISKVLALDKNSVLIWLRNRSGCFDAINDSNRPKVLIDHFEFSDGIPFRIDITFSKEFSLQMDNERFSRLFAQQLEIDLLFLEMGNTGSLFKPDLSTSKKNLREINGYIHMIS
ncbi:MAG: hypothetical protein EOO43_14070 [Flavobacterium sp.]|nr:MAG: hypothetical protein EOO43_14070 [Flavobacterium sp.]